jgi:hypothetical protein
MDVEERGCDAVWSISAEDQRSPRLGTKCNQSKAQQIAGRMHSPRAQPPHGTLAFTVQQAMLRGSSNWALDCRHPAGISLACGWPAAACSAGCGCGVAADGCSSVDRSDVGHLVTVAKQHIARCDAPRELPFRPLLGTSAGVCGLAAPLHLRRVLRKMPLAGIAALVVRWR